MARRGGRTQIPSPPTLLVSYPRATHGKLPQESGKVLQRSHRELHGDLSGRARAPAGALVAARTQSLRTMADSGASSEAGSSTLGNPILSSPAGGAGAAAAGPSSAALEVEIVAGDGEPQRKYARTQKRAELHPEAKLSDEQRVTMDKLLEQLDQQASVVITNPLAKGALRPRCPENCAVCAPRRPRPSPAAAAAARARTGRAGGGRGRGCKTATTPCARGHPAADGGCPPPGGRPLAGAPPPAPPAPSPPSAPAAGPRGRRARALSADRRRPIAVSDRRARPPASQTTRSCT